jgi:hypothetical protein
MLYFFQSIINGTYMVEGFGEAKPPQDPYFLVMIAGFAGNHHQKGMILGGPQAPGTLWVNLPLGWRPCKRQL